MQVAAPNHSGFCKQDAGGWLFAGWASACLTAGITDRRGDARQLLNTFSNPPQLVEAGQVHGGSIAVVESAKDLTGPIAGCDALVTNSPGLMLTVRTADCMPIFFADPHKGVVGLAHVGWRGLSNMLPLRMIGALANVFHSFSKDILVALGPSIRVCCYNVGQEFIGPFGPFIQRNKEQLKCNLADAAVAQLSRAGIELKHITDCGRCTFCEGEEWFSLRREGNKTGRMTSFIMLHPNTHGC